nr:MULTISPECIES: head-tail connector protein [unclassified Providencia]
MSFPTVDELKRQCYIDGDHDNDLLQQSLSSAIAEVKRLTNRNLYDDVVPESDPDGLLLSADIKLRLMQMVGFWYENREGQSLPESLCNALRVYRIRPMRGQKWKQVYCATLLPFSRIFPSNCLREPMMISG